MPELIPSAFISSAINNSKNGNSRADGDSDSMPSGGVLKHGKDFFMAENKVVKHSSEARQPSTSSLVGPRRLFGGPIIPFGDQSVRSYAGVYERDG
jgi:hypothetical protein